MTEENLIKIDLSLLEDALEFMQDTVCDKEDKVLYNKLQQAINKVKGNLDNCFICFYDKGSEIIQIGDPVITPHGEGVVMTKEPFRTERFGIKLNYSSSKHFDQSPVNYYLRKEIAKIITFK